MKHLHLHYSRDLAPSDDKNACNSVADEDQAMKLEILTHEIYCLHFLTAHYCTALHWSTAGTVSVIVSRTT